jgi:PhzF family phenazine biosynthesis protein
MGGSLYRYSAFTTTPAGGNPAGIWVGDALPADGEMQKIAAEVAYPETAFVAPARGLERKVRYFSPAKEIDFCGHATVATGVLFGETLGAGDYRFSTNVGLVPVSVRERDGRWQAALTSVAPRHERAPRALLRDALAALEWREDELEPAIPAARIFAGNWHLLLAARTPERLADLDYDYERLKALMLADGLTTIQLVWREREDLYHARDPFPVGGIVEDPATGSGAAALGGYLRDAGLLNPPASIVILQGETMGRPSRLEVEIPAKGGVVVSGFAAPMADSAG